MVRKGGTWVRFLIVASVYLTGAAALPLFVHAQGGGFMWCQADAVTSDTTSRYYSAFFSASAWEAQRKANAFAANVKNSQEPTATVTANHEPADYDRSVAGRNAEMKATPGKILDWVG